MKIKINEHDDCFITQLTSETPDEEKLIETMIIKCQFGDKLASWGSGYIELVTKKDVKK
jgi:hypothetical protein